MYSIHPFAPIDLCVLHGLIISELVVATSWCSSESLHNIFQKYHNSSLCILGNKEHAGQSNVHNAFKACG